MKELEYPFDSSYILKNRRRIKRELLLEIEKQNTSPLKKKIAILGGSTTHDIKDILELFLLNYGILPSFYESEYAQYWNCVMFDGALDDFMPDIIFIHTSTRNILEFPNLKDSRQAVDEKLDSQFSHFEAMWKKAREKYGCAIIQNNFGSCYKKYADEKQWEKLYYIVYDNNNTNLSPLL